MNRLNPFGEPEGGRANIEDVMEGFIETNFGSFSSVVDADTCDKVRVIVGAKGTGKTVYMRRFSIHAEQYLRDANRPYVVVNEPEFPETDAVKNFCKLWSKGTVSEKWTNVWKCALTRALVSHLLYVTALSSVLTDKDRENIMSFVGADNILPAFSCEMSAYAELKAVLSRIKTVSDFEMYVNNYNWDMLDQLIGKLLVKMPKIFFFIDCIDEEYHRAPMYWMRCQKGLFYRTMKIIRSSHYRDKFNVVITIRDQVYSNILESEDKSKFLNTENILVLKWNYRAIKHFFSEKISQLEDCYFFRGAQEKTMKNWLGIDSISNKKRGKKELLLDYILRHTRMLPRDVVQIGNALSATRREAAKLNWIVPDDFYETFVRDKVAGYAYICGDELFDSCANQLLSIQEETTQRYSSTNEFEKQIKEVFRERIQEFNLDCFTWDQLQELTKKITSQIGGEASRFFDMLWQSGGIGYLEGSTSGIEEEHFFVDNSQNFRLPPQKDRYVFSSCVKDYVGITAITTSPIMGCLK